MVATLGAGTLLAMENALDHAAVDATLEDAIDEAVAALPSPADRGAAEGMRRLLEEWRHLSRQPEHRAVVATALDDALMRTMGNPGREIGQ